MDFLRMNIYIEELLWIIPALPLAGFVILALFGKRMRKAAAAWTGTLTVGISWIISMLYVLALLSSVPAFSERLWTWAVIGSFRLDLSLYLDSLSAVFILIITFVGFLIHLYSVEFMKNEEGYSRFFAWMNLFVGSMLLLVLAGDLLLLYIGWEGVGLSSYLLIGFWYRNPDNGYAARKAFVVTRAGDTAMAIGLFMLLTGFESLDIRSIMQSASVLPAGSLMIPAVAALFLAGAAGKSAQLPLQTWLPDAMAGPTPVSALIHAATMVTAGVYLIARTHVLYELSPAVMYIVSVTGAITLLVAGVSACFQYNIKKVLAYSTISQVGYMFLGLGAGAWTASVFHFVTHAFFKALLFLGAGSVIFALHEEHDMRKMGGLRKTMPFTFITLLIGAMSLSGIPFVTAGFFSKDMILYYTYAHGPGSLWLYIIALAGVLLTSFYSFRMIFVTFFGKQKTEIGKKPGWRMNSVIAILSLFTIAAGYIELPASIANIHFISEFLSSSLPAPVAHGGSEIILQIIASAISLTGIIIAYLFYIYIPEPVVRIRSIVHSKELAEFFFNGWGFDRLYNTAIVGPFISLARINKNDFIDYLNRGIAALGKIGNVILTETENGMLGWYAFTIVLGTIIIITIAVFL